MSANEPRARLPVATDMAAVAFIQASALCKDLDPELMVELCDQAELLSYDPGAVVVAADELDDALYFLFEGAVSICVADERGMVEVARLERPSLFGELMVLARQPYPRPIVAASDVRVVRAPGELLRRMADASPRVGRLLAALMAARQRDFERAPTQ